MGNGIARSLAGPEFSNRLIRSRFRPSALAAQQDETRREYELFHDDCEEASRVPEPCRGLCGAKRRCVFPNRNDRTPGRPATEAITSGRCGFRSHRNALARPHLVARRLESPALGALVSPPCPKALRNAPAPLRPGRDAQTEVRHPRRGTAVIHSRYVALPRHRSSRQDQARSRCSERRVWPYSGLWIPPAIPAGCGPNRTGLAPRPRAGCPNRTSRAPQPTTSLQV